MRNRSYDFFYVAAVATFIWQNSDKLSAAEAQHHLYCFTLSQAYLWYSKHLDEDFASVQWHYALPLVFILESVTIGATLQYFHPILTAIILGLMFSNERAYCRYYESKDEPVNPHTNSRISNFAGLFLITEEEFNTNTRHRALAQRDVFMQIQQLRGLWEPPRRPRSCPQRGRFSRLGRSQ